jgi:hypothetical protein
MIIYCRYKCFVAIPIVLQMTYYVGRILLSMVLKSVSKFVGYKSRCLDLFRFTYQFLFVWVIFKKNIGWEYRNELYRTISGIFPHQHERNKSACAPLTSYSCTPRKWLLPACRFINVLTLNSCERGKLGRIHLRATSCCVLRCLHGCQRCQKAGETF